MSFHGIIDVPWLMGGDFNTFLTLDEHKRRSTPTLQSLQDFNECISACSLQSINYQGSSYTWCDGRWLGRVWCCLDRFLWSWTFYELFPALHYQHLNRTYIGSLTSAFSLFYRGLCPGNILPIFGCLATHPDFDNFVRHHWESFLTVGGMWGFYAKLRQLKHRLRRWNKDVFRNIFDAVAAAEAETTRREREYNADPADHTRAEYHRSMTGLHLAQSRALSF